MCFKILITIILTNVRFVEISTFYVETRIHLSILKGIYMNVVNIFIQFSTKKVSYIISACINHVRNNL